ncbi:hypothetical protein HS088_TW04G00909 [Tripterygium wilfordii]|uniref:Uncharacterized protein n=1 Tax=Tripterygium wilfordii TaxID=458696 RepID=A0A7J7DRE8_TRIWF|nr:hypothetical protein HS088_TW04G00909 [Tripterygium wilfordii]
MWRVLKTRNFVRFYKRDKRGGLVLQVLAMADPSLSDMILHLRGIDSGCRSELLHRCFLICKEDVKNRWAVFVDSCRRYNEGCRLAEDSIGVQTSVRVICSELRGLDINLRICCSASNEKHWVRGMLDSSVDDTRCDFICKKHMFIGFVNCNNPLYMLINSRGVHTCETSGLYAFVDCDGFRVSGNVLQRMYNEVREKFILILYLMNPGLYTV